MTIAIQNDVVIAPGSVVTFDDDLVPNENFYAYELQARTDGRAGFSSLTNEGTVIVQPTGTSLDTVGVHMPAGTFHNAAGASFTVYGGEAVTNVGDVEIINDGLLQVFNGYGLDIWFTGAASPASQATVVNTGTIRVTGGLAVTGYVGSLDNSGVIDATSDRGAVAMYVSSLNDAGGFTNSGTIILHSATGTAVSIAVHHDLTVTNSGTITGPQALEVSGDGAVEVDNTGTLAGDVGLTGDGVYDLVNRGAIEGSVVLGAAADLYDGRSGRVSGAVSGGAGDDTLYAGLGQTVLSGGGGQDLLYAGADDDTLTGGAGADRFILNGSASSTTVTDFTRGQDTIDLSAFGGLHNLGDVLQAASQSGPATVIDLPDGATLTLQGVQKTSLKLADFTFASRSTPGDFTSDAKADIAVRTPDGSIVLYRSGATGVSFTSTTLDGPSAGLQSQLPGHAQDFNGDGVPDLLFRGADGAMQLWLMDAAGRHTVTDLQDRVLNGRVVAGAGDLNGDGRADLLLSRSNGHLVAWKDPGSPGAATKDLGIVPADQHLQAVADFDGDGKADLLFVDDAGGAQVWRSGASLSFTTSALGSMGAGWHALGAADFNGDGRADILWRSDTGALGLWVSSGAADAYDQVTPGVMSAAWTVQELADFNGDGRADILWEEAGGHTRFWISTASPTAFATATGPMLHPDWGLI